MLFDLSSARRFQRRDGTAVYAIAETSPSKIVHLFQPGHADYEAAAAMHAAAVAEEPDGGRETPAGSDHA